MACACGADHAGESIWRKQFVDAKRGGREKKGRRGEERGERAGKGGEGRLGLVHIA